MTSPSIIHEIQHLLRGFVGDFESTIDIDSISAKEYWEQIFLRTGEKIYEIITDKIGSSSGFDSGRCSEYVLCILENFDQFSCDNPELHFPTKNLGRCRIQGLKDTGQKQVIPHYKLSTNEFLRWDYHEIIEIIEKSDLKDHRGSLISQSMIYDIQMNKLHVLKLRGFIAALIPTNILRMFVPDVITPDNVIFSISHRYTGMAIYLDAWEAYKIKDTLLTKRWYS